MFLRRPFQSLLISYPEFEYVVLGRNMKHLLPVNPYVIEEVDNSKKRHEASLIICLILLLIPYLDEKERVTLLCKTWVESKELMLIII